MLKRQQSAWIPAGLENGSLMPVAHAVNYDHPELFYVDFHRISCLTGSTGTEYEICYLYDRSKVEHHVRGLEQRLEHLMGLAGAVRYGSEYERCRWVHDILVKNVRYCKKAEEAPGDYPEAFHVAGVLGRRRAVCEGFAKAFLLLAERMGLKAAAVTGSAASESNLPHAWNLVQIDGGFVHVDVTWDCCVSMTSEYLRYDYFCLTDELMRTDHQYQRLPPCSGPDRGYFRTAGKLIYDRQHLRQYLVKEAKKGAEILYFRLNRPGQTDEKLRTQINEMVCEQLDHHIRTSYAVDAVINEKQSVFFYRILKNNLFSGDKM